MNEETLAIYVIYDHPKDFPNTYVAKRDWIMSGRVVRDTAFILVSPNVEQLRDIFKQNGLTKLPRDPNDVPVILEYWI
jgi:hypothetical protein